MKKYLIVLLGFFCLSGYSEDGIMELSTVPFDPKGIEVRWEIQQEKETNSLKIYKAIPNHFSESTVSNLIALVQSSGTNKTKPFERKDWNSQSWIMHEDKAILHIYPDWGAVVLRVEVPNKFGEEGDLVPPPSELILRTSNLVTQVFHISTNELAYKKGKPDFRCLESSRGSYNKVQKKQVKCVPYRSVHFERSIDGYTLLAQYSGGYIRFVDHGKVSMVDLTWPNLEVTGELPRPSIESLKVEVSQGRARIGDPVLESATRLALDWMEYLYVEERTANEQIQYYPWVRLGGRVYNQTTNVPVCLFCKIPGGK